MGIMTSHEHKTRVLMNPVRIHTETDHEVFHEFRVYDIIGALDAACLGNRRTSKV